MCKNLFVTFLFSVFCFVVSLAQETHEVKNGETLYSVSKQYNVSTSEIIKANPSAKRGLRRGMSIVIPILHERIDTVIYILHSVRPLESFYSIKNKYEKACLIQLFFVYLHSKCVGVPTEYKP